MNDKRTMLRHALATVAYRAAKTMRDAPAGYPETRVCAGSRSAREIVAHMGDLFEWGMTIVDGEARWHAAEPLAWEEECRRFHETLARLDARLASDTPIAVGEEQLLQGPIADALTHVGQLALLRRSADGPIRGENYFIAGIEPGRVGAEQEEPRFEW